MLTYYMSKYLLQEKASEKAATIVVEGVEEEHIREAARATEGFSGGFPALAVRGLGCTTARVRARKLKSITAPFPDDEQGVLRRGWGHEDSLGSIPCFPQCLS